MAFPESFLDELVARSDIADVVGSYVRLTKKGANMFGLCPFHGEKTPSFSVSQDKQIYHCFGCGKGGGVINFIMEIENLNFPDAVRFLADRAGMKVPEDDGDQLRSKRDRLLALSKDAARWFHKQLKNPACKDIVAYINSRAISPAMVTRFGLGAAPDSWDGLISAMTALGYQKSELLDAGLAVKNKTGGIYDRFRGRLIFPIIDIRGNVIGFGGRVLDGSTPKYLNSPETLIFNKSRNLFALNLAKKSKMDMIIMTEGYMDTLALHQAGIDCAVASLGTALTAEHGNLLARYTKKVVLAYDSDEAGMKAAQRAIQILSKCAIEVKLLRMNGAKDPDEYIKKFGRDAFINLLEKSENHVDYRLLSLRGKFDLAADDQRIAYLKEAVKLLATLPGAVERDVYARRVAEETKVSPEAVLSEVNRELRRRIAAEKKRQSRDALHPAQNFQPAARELRYENLRSAAAEEGVIRLLLANPDTVKCLDSLRQEEFTSPFLGRAYSALLRRIEAGHGLSLAALASEFSPEEMSRLTAILQKPEPERDEARAARDYIEIIRTERLRADGDAAALIRRARERQGYQGG